VDKFDLEKFLSSDNYYLFPPYVEESMRLKLLDIWNTLHLNNHVFLLSSGTTSINQIKSYALSKESLLNNAKAVNEKFQFSKNDVWMSSLPYYHVGGLGIYLRSYLTNSKVINSDQKWSASEFIDLVWTNSISIASVVPTQLYDLVSSKKMAPKSLRALFVGGDFLSHELRDRALDLNYPIIQTYGMTELCSQIASSFVSRESSHQLEILPIHKIYQSDTKSFIESSSLCSAEIIMNKNEPIIINKIGKIFELKDHLVLSEIDQKNYLEPKGRTDEFFKISGHLYSQFELKEIFEKIAIEQGAFSDVILRFLVDERKGHILEVQYQDLYKNKVKSFIEKLEKSLPKPLCPIRANNIGVFKKSMIGKVKLVQ